VKFLLFGVIITWEGLLLQQAIFFCARRMFNGRSTMREFHIDLSLSPEKRWKGMDNAGMAKVGRELIKHTLADAASCGGLIGDSSSRFARMAGTALLTLLKTAVYVKYKASGSPYEGDIKAWATMLNLPFKDVLFANLIYEVSQMADRLYPMGCTSVAAWVNGRMVHVRNMDWPLKGIGPGTVKITYYGRHGPFTTVGWPGYVGVLSGVAENRFSATINQLPQTGKLHLDGMPSHFVLRKVFDTMATYDSAIDVLKNYNLVAATIFMVVGVKKGEAAVVEYDGTTVVTRRIRGAGPLTAANHAEGTDSELHKDDESVMDSMYREERMDAAMKKVLKSGNKGPTILLKVADSAKWELTAQQMALVPSTGEASVRIHNTNKAVSRLLG